MKNKKLFLWFLTIIFVTILVYFVIAADDFTLALDGINSSSPSWFENISGSAYSLNFTFHTNSSHSDYGITNVTIMFQAPNGSFMNNVTITNTTANQTVFSAAFDTTSLAEAVYNLTVLVYNKTNGADSYTHSSNESAVLNVTVDNTAPTVLGLGNFTNEGVLLYGLTDNGSFPYTLNDTNLFNTSGSTLSFNTTSKDSAIIGRYQDSTRPNFVTFEFNNGTSIGPRFNVTSVNTSGTWRTAYNVSSLRGGTHKIVIHSEDFAGNINRTNFFTFTVNTAPNVTFNRSSGRDNFSVTSYNQTFLVSVSTIMNNSDMDEGNMLHVIFELDNASGNSQNVTAPATSHESASTRINFSTSINVSTLEEGTHTLTAYVNDSRGNFNYSESITFIVDKTLPSVSISCTSSPVTGDKVDCTCTASDALSGVGTGPFFQGTTSTTESTTAGSAGTFDTSGCFATDRSGNKRTVTGSYTVSEATSAGSGSGGSGGGSSTGSTGNFGQKTWTSIYQGETATVEVENGVIGVTEVSFGVTETAYGGWLKVSRRDSAPADATAFDRRTYRIVEITTGTSLKEDILANRKIDFKVEKSWLAGIGLSRNSVGLFRLVNNNWVALPTTVGEDDGTYIHFSAATPGFSYFLIGEKGEEEPVEVPEVDLPPIVVPPEDVPEEPVSGGAGLAVVIVLVVLAVLAAVWFLVGRNKK